MELTNETGNSGNISEIFSQLTKDQLRFVVAMQECGSKKEAAKNIKVPVKTVYNWPPIVDEAVKLLALDVAEAARQMRKSALAKAVAVKIAGLDSADERVRQAAATEIIEAELGKARQSIELDGNLDVSNIVRVIEHGA